MSTSDPILYPLPGDGPEGRRQEAARARAELAQTLDELAARVDARRLVRPRRVAPVVAGAAAAIGTLVGLRRRPGLAGLAAAAAAVAGFVGARRLTRSARPRPVPTPALVEHAGPERDVVDLLLSEHRQIDALFAAALAAPDRQRLDTFANLVEFLRRHEHGEQEVVRPVVTEVGGEAVAAARLAEEAAADRTLASLISRGVTDDGYPAGLARLRDQVRAHAAHEEAEEFPLLRSRVPAERLQQLAGQLRSAHAGEPWTR